MKIQSKLDEIGYNLSFCLAHIRDIQNHYPSDIQEILDFIPIISKLNLKMEGNEDLNSINTKKLNTLDDAIKILTLSLYKTYPIRRQDLPFNNLLKPSEQVKSELKIIRTLNKKIAFAETILGKTSLKSSPLLVNIDPTSNCNYRCRICTHGNKMSYLAKIKNFPISTIKKLVGTLKRIDALYVFGLGEPTMAPALSKLSETIVEHGVNAQILTNGSTMGKIEIPLSVYSQIGISFDADNAKTFEAIRVNSDFDKIISRIKEFKEEFPNANLYFNCTINRLNLNQINGIIKIASDLGIGAINLNKMIEYHAPQKGMELSKEDTPEMEKIFSDAISYSTSLGVALRISISSDLLIDTNIRISEQEIYQNLKKDMPSEDSIRSIPLEEAIENCRLAILSISRLYSDAKTIKISETPEHDFKASIAEMTTQLETLEEEINAKVGEDLELPYCTSPWLRTLITSNSSLRPCCVLPKTMGSIEFNNGVENVWNGEKYIELRNGLKNPKSTQTQAPTFPSSCKNCKFIERRLYESEIIDYGKSLGINVKPCSNS